jgi:hypothetical protein
MSARPLSAEQKRRAKELIQREREKEEGRRRAQQRA